MAHANCERCMLVKRNPGNTARARISLALALKTDTSFSVTSWAAGSPKSVPKSLSMMRDGIRSQQSELEKVDISRLMEETLSMGSLKAKASWSTPKAVYILAEHLTWLL
ncbi:uncharacterized protein FYW49_005626 [Xenentodon cancila]